MKKEEKGVTITYLPHKVVLGATSNEGLLALDYLMRGDSYAGKGVRARYNISVKDFPHMSYKQMLNGKVYLIMFYKDTTEV